MTDELILEYILKKVPLPPGFTHCSGGLDLYGYPHPLPEGFKAHYTPGE